MLSVKEIIVKVLYKIVHIVYKNNKRKSVEMKFFLLKGRKLDLDNPKTFNEKICWVSVFYYNPLYEKCSDKIEVRDYVKSKGLEKILTTLYRVYDDVDQICLDDLPERFVIKTTHSSGGIVVVYDKKEINVDEMKETLKKSLNTNLYEMTGEWQYKNLKPRIMVEELIETNKELLLDYKFFCFNGKVYCSYVAHGTTSGDETYCVDFFDRDFNWINVKRTDHKNYGPISKPPQYEEMISAAERLSEDFGHVRVDLYNENGRIYFGELTFTTSNGHGFFEPESFDYELGKQWNLDDMKKEMRV